MMRALIKSIAVSVWLSSIGGAAAAQTTVAGATLFQNVRIYDGTGKSLSAPSNVLVRGNRIERISRAPIPVDSVVGAYMQVRGAAILAAGLLDERFFMYGEDLDWAKRIKDAGWEVWYNGAVEITHVKEAASSQSSKSRIDFYEAMWLFYQKHYRSQTNFVLDKLIVFGIVGKGGLDVAKHLWRYCNDERESRTSVVGQVNVDST